MPAVPAVPTSTEFTDDEMQAFAEKLETWRSSLSDREQQLLDLGVQTDSESPANEEVSGFANINMLTAQRELMEKERAKVRGVLDARRSASATAVGNPYGFGDMTGDLT